METISSKILTGMTDDDIILFMFLCLYSLGIEKEYPNDGFFVWVNSDTEIREETRPDGVEVIYLVVSGNISIDNDFNEPCETWVYIEKSALKNKGWELVENINIESPSGWIRSPVKGDNHVKYLKLIFAGFLERQLKMDLGIAPIIKKQFPAFNSIVFVIMSYEFIQSILGIENTNLGFMNLVNVIKSLK